MNKLRSLNVKLVLAVFIMMICASILSGILLFILVRYNIISTTEKNPLAVLIIGFIVSTIIGTILTFFVGNYVLKPMNELIKATKEIAKGNFNIKVSNLNYERELGELIKNFNIMTNELNNKEMFNKDFINNFSHEFRTPIVSIRGFARQLQKTSLTDDERLEFTDIIIRESERLSNMSSNILILTKLENQEIITEKKFFSLDEQIRNCILLLQMQWEKKNIDFNLELDSVEYFSNEEMLSQIWVNLLNNAIKFSKEHGEINVQCQDEGSNIKVKISDNGIGMDDDTIHHIFEKFYQGDLAHKSEGNGLGLSLVKRIVDLCGGKVVVKSQFGKGTEFIIRLPK
ncbi:HAMP domain-containing histidine kinase [Clostridium sp. SHJSY1]|uniref:HAMP domain-containing sensor histidine kinase n=1 Tax=Clostridium sp. SHJSY1 TaxID=2942483 RepID=UPI002874E487|nr:HAMP domain-containing sensor histidine kinase [Clostridium sp. SHJSY1]MDS0525235.1 HAMP domain-containing histidine kinase [Clostridium sp. SHJSY1]